MDDSEAAPLLLTEGVHATLGSDASHELLRIGALPTYGVLPRIGPFALDWFRLLFYWLCFLSFLVWDPLRQAREGRLTVFHVAAFAVALGLTSWICYDHYVIAKILTDSFMFFSAREAWLAGIAAMLSIIACWRLWGAPSRSSVPWSFSTSPPGPTGRGCSGPSSAT
ncbi:hypothetical protein HC022_02265 [Salipiger sp. HF18]|uniref:hypothetical protein n=1 Tax=Salipiger sp. HF18 TaxID=2721557 RepID=UPI00142DD043|nr:hypothetical protein [Salipiger sp. HF18]NIY95116.1 hypothetical protein [Salipiger sp. HF18]